MNIKIKEIFKEDKQYSEKIKSIKLINYNVGNGGRSV